jgi:hypothetical protein
MSPTLTERTYLGDGYQHLFQNDKTGEYVHVPCTDKEYFALGEQDIQPTLKGHTWLSSQGGTYKVDTPDGRLGLDEYCVIGADVVVRLDNPSVVKAWDRLPAQAIANSQIIPQVWQLL